MFIKVPYIPEKHFSEKHFSEITLQNYTFILTYTNFFALFCLKFAYSKKNVEPLHVFIPQPIRSDVQSTSYHFF